MEEFVENWYGKDSGIGRRLTAFLQQPLSLRGLPATPLTLALVAILYESGTKEVPANLTELFEKYIELALGRWDISRDISLQYEWRVKEFLLRKISWEMHQQRRLEIGCHNFESAVKRLGTERGLDIDVVVFCDEVVNRSELLFQNVDGEYEFKHRAFQDYFVGAEISGRADKKKLIIDTFQDLWWAQAVFFACGLRPEDETCLRAILDEVQVSGSDALAFTMNLGVLTQATYLAPRQVKSEVVVRVLDSFVDAWEYICDHYEEYQSEAYKHIRIPEDLPGHLLWISILDALAETALGSMTLSQTLSELAEQYVSQPLDHLSARERTRLEWQAFLLAVACAKCDNVSAFISLFRSGIIADPTFLLFMQYHAEMMEKRPWVGARDRDSIGKLSRKLKKRLARSRQYLASLRHAAPIPLPSPDDLGDVKED